MQDTEEDIFILMEFYFFFNLFVQTFKLYRYVIREYIFDREKNKRTSRQNESSRYRISLKFDYRHFKHRVHGR